MPEVRKVVSVVFCDLAGSTALAERLDPEALRRLMRVYFEEMRVVVENHGGVVEKFIGDAVVAVFGVPVVHEDDALRAVRAAVSMQARIDGINEGMGSRLDVRLQARVGVNTGPVIAAVGREEHALVAGDAVNVAARFQQSAAPGEVIMGAATRVLVGSAVRAEPLESLSLKGKAGPVDAWRVLEVVDDVPAYRRPIATPFVGRRAELERIVGVFHEAVDRRTCMSVSVIGEPGIGKSRLAREAIGALSAARVLVGRCMPYGTVLGHSPLAEIVRQLAGGEAEAGLEELLAAEADGPLVARLVAETVGQVEGASSAAEMQWAVRRLFELLAREQPLLVVLDDLHWGQPAMLDLVEYLATMSDGAPLLLLCTARADVYELRPDWQAPREREVRLALAPLSPHEADSLANDLPGGSGLPVETRRRLQEVAAGNPLFLEQLVAAGGPDPAAMPPTIQALLAARIDSLDATTRAVVERAAVEGRLFHRGAVTALLPEGERETVGRALMTLVRKELIRPDQSRFPGDDGFRFVHALVRDAAYEAIPKESRAGFHLGIGTWLSERPGLSEAERGDLVAYHLERTCLLRDELGMITDDAVRDRAVEALTHSGRLAADHGDHRTAAGLQERAIALLPSGDARQPDLLLALGNALRQSGKPSEAVQLLARSRDLARAAGDRRGEWLAAIEMQPVLVAVDPDWSQERAAEETRRALGFFQDIGDTIAAARAWMVMADVVSVEGQFDSALRALDEAVRHARAAAGASLEVEAEANALDWLLFGSTPVAAAIRRVEAARARFEQLGRLGLLAHAEIALGVLLAYRGEFTAGRYLIDTGRERARELGLRTLYGWGNTQAGTLEHLARDLDAAERELRAAKVVFVELGDGAREATVNIDLGRVLEELDRLDEAEELLDSASRWIPPGARGQAPLLARRAKILAKRGDHERAEQLARSAAIYADGWEALAAPAAVYFALAEVLEMAGNQEEAAKAAAEALSRFEAKGATARAAAVRQFLRHTAAGV